MEISVRGISLNLLFLIGRIIHKKEICLFKELLQCGIYLNRREQLNFTASVQPTGTDRLHRDMVYVHRYLKGVQKKKIAKTCLPCQRDCMTRSHSLKFYKARHRARLCQSILYALNNRPLIFAAVKWCIYATFLACCTVIRQCLTVSYSQLFIVQYLPLPSF